jgi:acid stress-induced BolA-like protein IbaG/YrbA
METIKKKVKGILLEGFGKRSVRLETHPDGRIRGSIVSENFVGKDHLVRQHKIWALLRKKLTKSELNQILGFLAYTPEEHEAYSNGVTYPVPRKPIKGLEVKVKNILLQRFAEDELKLETDSKGRVSGFIVSDQFIDVDDLERQDMIWDLLLPQITPTERGSIIAFLPFTPVEYEAYSEQSFAP